MSYYYSYGPSLSDQGISPDDFEYRWRCEGCEAEGSAPTWEMPRGWEFVQTGPTGADSAALCAACVATS